MTMRFVRRRLRGARRNRGMHVPAAPSRTTHQPGEERHGENDRQGP